MAKYLVLTKLARKYLAFQATTDTCERLFSIYVRDVNVKKASLEPISVNNLFCLSKWLNK